MELKETLFASTIAIEEISGGDGEESTSTQRLREALAAAQVAQVHVTIEKRIYEVPLESVSHETDYVRTFPEDARIVLKIEWNSKDLYDSTTWQRKAVSSRMAHRKPMSLHDAFVGDKYGDATTYWHKLENCAYRGVGNPCPLFLIGLPESIVTFYEGGTALAEGDAAVAAEAVEGGKG